MQRACALSVLPVLSIVNGVIVPHRMMPNPWRDFVYYVK
jgi:hypothetical protein